MGQYGKNQSNYDIFRIGPIPVSPITARSESAKHFDNSKANSREILDWLINKGIITWCFSYWPSYRSSVCCIGIRLRLRPIQQALDLWLGQYEKHHVIILYSCFFCLFPHLVYTGLSCISQFHLFIWPVKMRCWLESRLWFKIYWRCWQRSKCIKYIAQLLKLMEKMGIWSETSSV